MEKNKKSSDELNYKQAYLYLFHQVTYVIKRLKAIQIKAEDICIDEAMPDSQEIDTEEVLRRIAENIKTIQDE